MEQYVEKAPKVSLCRRCSGTGKVDTGRFFRRVETCPQCEGSGRVMVSAKIRYDIEPFRENE